MKSIFIKNQYIFNKAYFFINTNLMYFIQKSKTYN